MLRRKISNHLISTLVFLILVSLVYWQLKFSLFFFWLGIFFGNLLLAVDNFFYIYFQAPYEFTSQRVQRFLAQKNFKQGIGLLWETQEERKRMVLHSVLFQIVLVVLGFFVLTSSASLFGKGLVLGLLLHSLTDQVLEFVKKGEIRTWFWHFKLEISPNAQALYFVLLILVFVFFSFFLV